MHRTQVCVEMALFLSFASKALSRALTLGIDLTCMWE